MALLNLIIGSIYAPHVKIVRHSMVMSCYSILSGAALSTTAVCTSWHSDWLEFVFSIISISEFPACTLRSVFSYSQRVLDPPQRNMLSIGASCTF